jgi:hypothetical protein
VKFVESFPGRLKENLCPQQLLIVEELTKALQIVALPNNSKEGTTGVLRAQLDEFLEGSGWKESFRIDNLISLEFPTANYTLDLSLDSIDVSCTHKHRYFIEFCFDNRQAIGTNLLKFEVASKNAELQDRVPLPILICATAQAIKQFGWDGGVASYQEYDHALRIPYKNVVTHPPVLIALF